MDRRVVKAAVVAAWLALCVRGALAGGIEVPVDGELTADNNNPRTGDVIHVRLDVTARQPAETLTLAIQLPRGVTLATGAITQQVFHAVAEGQTVTLVTELKVTAAGEKQLAGIATLADTPAFRLSKSFILMLSPEPKPLPKVQYGTNDQGQSLIIYQSGK